MKADYRNSTLSRKVPQHQGDLEKVSPLTFVCPLQHPTRAPEAQQKRWQQLRGLTGRGHARLCTSTQRRA